MITIDRELCTGCGDCVDTCPVVALDVQGNCVVWSEDDCISCGECVRACQENALVLEDD